MNSLKVYDLDGKEIIFNNVKVSLDTDNFYGTIQYKIIPEKIISTLKLNNKLCIIKFNDEIHILKDIKLNVFFEILEDIKDYVKHDMFYLIKSDNIVIKKNRKDKLNKILNVC